MKNFLFNCLILGLEIIATVTAFRYVSQAYEKLYLCAGKEHQPYTKCFNIENDYYRVNDDELRLNGSFEVRHQFTGPIQVQIDFWRKIRGIWQPLPYRKTVPDLCSSLNPDDQFYETIQDWLSMSPKCPPDIGSRTQFDMSMNKNFTFQGRLDEGDYKMELHVFQIGSMINCCIGIRFELRFD